MKTWLITGCSTGLGKSLAKTVLKKGYQVVVTARNTDTLAEFEREFPKNALVLPLDVTDNKAISNTVKRAIEHFGSTSTNEKEPQWCNYKCFIHCSNTYSTGLGILCSI